MPEISLDGLLLVVAIAFGAPLLVDLAGLRRVPAVVVEIVAGIVVGPSVLGWVVLDDAIATLALLGLAFLLFLAGLEIDVRLLRGTLLRRSLGGYAASVAIALAVGLGLATVGVVDSPLIVAIALLATSLGVVLAVLADGGRSATPFGQLVVAGATIADVGAILLLTLAFSRDGSGPLATVGLVGSFVVVVVLLAAALVRAEHTRRVADGLVRLQDTTARIRVRGAFLLLVGLAVVAQMLGLELILGAFAAGAVLALVDRDERMTHPAFRDRLGSIGFGVFIPVFFVASGVAFDLAALTASASSLAAVPLFLAALLAVRGLPALAYRGALRGREVTAAAFLQATSLPFIVTATTIGVEVGALAPSVAAALVAAGLVSVLAFPVVAGILLGPAARPERADAAGPTVRAGVARAGRP